MKIRRFLGLFIQINSAFSEFFQINKKSTSKEKHFTRSSRKVSNQFRLIAMKNVGRNRGVGRIFFSGEALLSKDESRNIFYRIFIPIVD